MEGRGSRGVATEWHRGVALLTSEVAAALIGLLGVALGILGSELRHWRKDSRECRHE
jgi:hypothetical protein